MRYPELPGQGPEVDRRWSFIGNYPEGGIEQIPTQVPAVVRGVAPAYGSSGLHSAFLD
jgi:hypothetical protein